MPDWDDAASANAVRELAHLQRQTEAARAVLARLQQEVAETEQQLGGSRAARLLEANAQLLVATLRVRTDAEATALALTEVPRHAELDTLTGLPNRVLVLDRLSHAIASARRDGTQLALLFVELNNFKQIDDSLGHAFGDQVLKLAANCLVSTVRPADTVSRHGEDEFLVLLSEIPHPSYAALVAKNLIAALRLPIRFHGQALSLAASVGITLYPGDGEDAETLIERADAAMSHAKRQDTEGFAFHDKVAEDELGMPPFVDAPVRYSGSHAPTRGEHDRRHGQLQEANERLILAALNAQELQALAEQAQRKQTEFLAVVAHELGNPLAPIRTAAALLGLAGSNETLLARAQAIIERQVTHMARLVGDLLDVSRVKTGKLRLDCETIDMAGIIDASVETCLPSIGARRQHLDVQVPSGALSLQGDPVRLTQIFVNLLDNASKYTPDDGKIGLSVVVAGGTIVVSLSDSGIGITAKALPKVFEPFVQDPHAISFNRVGLGIGLTVVRELVEAHGGTVVASSAGPGLGSQFVVTLPALGS